jgi:hypothetical protein
VVLASYRLEPEIGARGECHYGEEGSSAEISVYPMMLGFTAADREEGMAVAGKVLPRFGR